jgi:hypothetical protein
MAVLTKEEALMVLKRACDYSRAKKSRVTKTRKKLIKAQTHMIAGLVKRARMEKRGWLNLVPLALAYARPLLRLVGRAGRVGRGVKALSRFPTNIARSIGTPIQYGMRGVGSGLSRVGLKGLGGRLLNRFKQPAAVGGLGQAARIGKKALGGLETASFGSMFLPMFVPPEKLPEWLGGYPEETMEMYAGDPMAQWQLRNKRLAGKGLWAPPPMQT